MISAHMISARHIIILVYSEGAGILENSSWNSADDCFRPPRLRNRREDDSPLPFGCCEDEFAYTGAKKFVIERLAAAGGQAASLNFVTSGGRNVPGGNSTSKQPDRKAADAMRWAFTISLYSASYALYSATVSV